MNEYIQLIETCETLKEATVMLMALREQVGFKDGSVYYDPSAARSKRFVCQTFFEDVPDATWLPHGMRRVIVPRGECRSLGLVSEPRHETADAHQ
jgi:hypothetical protein